MPANKYTLRFRTIIDNKMYHTCQVFDPKDLENTVSELNLDVDDDGDEGLAVTAIAVSPDGQELALGLRNGDVKLYELPSLEFKSILTRFTAPVLGLHYGMKDGGVM